MSIIQGNAHTSTGGYQIERSLRFNSVDSAYLTRTPATASGQNQWTFSCWFKRVSPGATQYFIGGNTTTSGARNEFNTAIDGNNNLTVWAFNNSSGYYFNRFSSNVYRDVSAWYHLVIQFDPDNGTSANRVIAYINNVQVTWGSSADSGAAGSIGSSGYRSVNNTFRNDIGGGYQTGGAPIYFSNAYMTEIHMVSGSIIAHTEFGEIDSNTGVWKPKKYGGSYGTNGFYLKFADNSNTTAATLGKDSSGNGNNWTPNGFSVTAGTGNDSLVDTPTPYGTDTGVGGEVRGNYATFNPITGGSSTTSNGNLDGVFAPINGARVSTIAVTSGKWYAEFVATSISSGYSVIGIGAPYLKGWTTSQESNANCVVKYSHINGGGPVGSWTMPTSSLNFTYTTGDLIGVALDMTTNTVTYYKNGFNVGNFTFTTGAAGSPVEVCFLMGHSDGSVNGAGYVNFGQRPFANAAPSDFKALCTQNFTTPTIGATSTTQANKYFDVTTYTGNGTNNRVITTNLNEVGLAWVKIRSSADDHRLANIVTGGNKHLKSNNTDVESTATTVIQAFSGSTFTVGTDNSVNVNGSTYVAWTWAANGTGSTNTAGTITSTVSANTTSGFSIVTYTGNGSTSSGQTIGHGLGIKPAMIITKKRSGGTDYGWSTWHKNLYNATWGQNVGIWLNQTSAQNIAMWSGVTNLSTTVFSPADLAYNNENGATYVNYVFAPVEGFSAFGSYSGNGSTDGAFIYTGFRPKFVLVKAFNNAENWAISDTARSPYNAANAFLRPDESSAETTGAMLMDFLSNGFKLRTTDTKSNGSGYSYIYAAFAESPFKYSLAR